jgi:23S rRNA pseudouridine2605 synthase
MFFCKIQSPSANHHAARHHFFAMKTMARRYGLVVVFWIMAFCVSSSQQLLGKCTNAFATRSIPLAFSTTTSYFPSQQRHFHVSTQLSASKSKTATLFRADRVLANRTGKSRSECFDLLQQKRIWEKQQVVSEEDHPFAVVAGPSAKISADADLWVDRTHAVPRPPPILKVYHKPKWVLSVLNDPHDRPSLDSVGILPEKMHPVGRLDYDTSGLLLFSSSGALTQFLLHPKHETEKEYIAVVVGCVDADALQQQLCDGVSTADGVHIATLLDVDTSSPKNVKDYLQTTFNALPPEYNHTNLRQRGYLNIFEETTELSTVRLTVTEGKHRMVRRILANSGHAVVGLHRQRLGVIDLGDLPVGETRELTPDELKWAEQLLSQNIKKKKKPYVKVDKVGSSDKVESSVKLGSSDKRSSNKLSSDMRRSRSSSSS